MKQIFWIAAAVFGIDVLTKWGTTVFLADQSIRLWKLVELKLTKNTGMALGLFANQQILGLILPPVVILLSYFLMRKYKSTAFTRTSYGLILGGFLGNFLERLVHGYVTDMIFLPWMPWFVCNAADIAICAGVFLLAISLLFRPKDWQEG